jgi:hypothetical protein
MYQLVLSADTRSREAYIYTTLVVGAENVLDPDSLLEQLGHRPLVLPNRDLSCLLHKVGNQHLLNRQVQHHTSSLLPSGTEQLDVGSIDRCL